MKFDKLLDALRYYYLLKCNIYIEGNNELVFAGYVKDIPYKLSEMCLSTKYPIEWVDKSLRGFTKDASGFIITLIK